MSRSWGPGCDRPAGQGHHSLWALKGTLVHPEAVLLPVPRGGQCGAHLARAGPGAQARLRGAVLPLPLSLLASWLLTGSWAFDPVHCRGTEWDSDCRSLGLLGTFVMEPTKHRNSKERSILWLLPPRPGPQSDTARAAPVRKGAATASRHREQRHHFLPQLAD